jgi:hypothetical protein
LTGILLRGMLKSEIFSDNVAATNLSGHAD